MSLFKYFKDINDWIKISYGVLYYVLKVYNEVKIRLKELKSLKVTLNEKHRSTGKNLGRCSTTLIIDLEMETTMRYHLKLLLWLLWKKKRHWKF